MKNQPGNKGKWYNKDYPFEDHAIKPLLINSKHFKYAIELRSFFLDKDIIPLGVWVLKESLKEVPKRAKECPHGLLYTNFHCK